MGKRLSTNMISSKNKLEPVEFKIYSCTVSESKSIIFIRKLNKNRSKKVYLIWDILEVHLIQKVRKLVANQKKCIKLLFLPSYFLDKNIIKYSVAEKHKLIINDELEKIKYLTMFQSNSKRILKYCV